MALSFRPDTAPLLVLVENKNAVAHDHSEQGGWGLEWIMPAAILIICALLVLQCHICLSFSPLL